MNTTARKQIFLPGSVAHTDGDESAAGHCGEVDVDGTAFVSGAPPLFDEYLRNVTRMAKLGGGIPLIYMHTQISTGNAICNATVLPLGGAACKPLSDAKTHADSRVMDANMSEVYYTKCAGGSDLPLFIPTASNSYGEVMREYVAKVFRLGAQGVYGPLDYRTAVRTLFLRPYLAHFCSFFRHFFAVFSVLTPGFQKVAPKDRGPAA